MMRRAINSPGYHVPIPGFSHLVTAHLTGTALFVSGLTARGPDGTILHVGDVGGQARQVLENLRAVLGSARATLDDVVQIRTYMRDIEQWAQVQRVWQEYWGAVWPASTLVEISRLYDDTQLIEMEAIALLPGRPHAKRGSGAARIARRKSRQKGRA
jgi:enamine deaminase RidA (YjgF/YER057c/UK114 family)